jgi:hypothetical protein
MECKCKWRKSTLYSHDRYGGKPVPRQHCLFSVGASLPRLKEIIPASGPSGQGLYYTKSTRVSVPSLELAPPAPLPQARVSPPPGTKEGGGVGRQHGEGPGEPIRTTGE